MALKNKALQLDLLIDTHFQLLFNIIFILLKACIIIYNLFLNLLFFWIF